MARLMPLPERPLTIALCLHGYFPDQYFGTAMYVRHLAAALKGLGHRPVILSARIHPEAPEPPEITRDAIDGIPVHRLLRRPPEGTRASFDDPTLRETLRDALADIRPDVVHVAHFLGLTVALHRAAADFCLPVFATFTDFHAFCHRGTLLNAAGSLCAGPDRSRTNCIACGLHDRATENPRSLGMAYLSSWIARGTTARLAPHLRPLLPAWIADDISAVIERPEILHGEIGRLKGALAPTRNLRDTYAHNGFTIPMKVSAFGVSSARLPKPHRGGAPLRVGYIGQIAPHKAPHLMVEAARRLAGKPARFEIWGGEDRHPAYAVRLRRRATGYPIQFRGAFAVEHMDAILQDIDVLVLPSIWPENSPLTLLHALAAHTPVIVSDVPGMTEFVQDRVNGFVVPKGDAAALTDALRRFLDDRTLARRMSLTTSYDRTPESMARDVLAFYAEHDVG